jgi:hypothetical protein
MLAAITVWQVGNGCALHAWTNSFRQTGEDEEFRLCPLAPVRYKL